MAGTFTDKEMQKLIRAYISLENYHDFKKNCPVGHDVKLPVAILVYYGFDEASLYRTTKLYEHFKASCPSWGEFVKTPDILGTLGRFKEEFKKSGFPEWKKNRRLPKILKASKDKLESLVLYDRDRFKQQYPEAYSGDIPSRTLSQLALDTSVDPLKSFDELAKSNQDPPRRKHEEATASFFGFKVGDNPMEQQQRLHEHEGLGSGESAGGGDKSGVIPVVDKTEVEVLREEVARLRDQLADQSRSRIIPIEPKGQSDSRNVHRDPIRAPGDRESSTPVGGQPLEDPAKSLQDRLGQRVGTEGTNGRESLSHTGRKEVIDQQNPHTLDSIVASQGQRPQVHFGAGTRLPSPIPRADPLRPDPSGTSLPFGSQRNPGLQNQGLGTPRDTQSEVQQRLLHADAETLSKMNEWLRQENVGTPRYESPQGPVPPGNNPIERPRHSSPIRPRGSVQSHRYLPATEMSQFDPAREGFDDLNRWTTTPQDPIEGVLGQGSRLPFGGAASAFLPPNNPTQDVPDLGSIPLMPNVQRFIIPLPIFKGEKNEWRNYKASMELYLSSVRAFSRKAQIQYLQVSLKSTIAGEFATQLENCGEQLFDVNQFWKNLDKRFTIKPKELHLENPERYLIEHPWDGQAHSFDAKLAEVEFRLRRQMGTNVSESVVATMAASAMRLNIPLELRKQLEQQRKLTRKDPFTDAQSLRDAVKEIFDDYENCHEDPPWDESWHKSGKHYPRGSKDKTKDEDNSTKDKNKKDNNSSKDKDKSSSSYPSSNKDEDKKGSASNNFRVRFDEKRGQNRSFDRGYRDRPPDRSNDRSSSSFDQYRGRSPNPGYNRDTSKEREESSKESSSKDKSDRSRTPDEKDQKSDRSRSKSPSGRSQERCPHCDKGHAEKDCWTKYPDRRPKSSIRNSSDQKSIEPPDYPGETSDSKESECEIGPCDDGIPRVPVNMGETPKRIVLVSGAPARALLDTGSCITAVSSKLAAKLAGCYQEGKLNSFDAKGNKRRSTAKPSSDAPLIQLVSDSKPIDLQCGNGELWTLSEKLVTVELLLDGRIVPFNVWVYPEKVNQYDILIGVNALKALGYSLTSPNGRQEWDVESVQDAIRIRPPNTPCDEITRYMTPQNHVLQGREHPEFPAEQCELAVLDAKYAPGEDKVERDVPENGIPIHLPKRLNIPAMRSRMIYIERPGVEEELVYFEPNLVHMNRAVGDVFIAPTLMRRHDTALYLEVRNVTGRKMSLKRNTLLGWICIGTEETRDGAPVNEVNRLEIMDEGERVEQLTSMIDWKDTMLENEPEKQEAFKKAIIVPFNRAFALTENEIGL